GPGKASPDHKPPADGRSAGPAWNCLQHLFCRVACRPSVGDADGLPLQDCGTRPVTGSATDPAAVLESRRSAGNGQVEINAGRQAPRTWSGRNWGMDSPPRLDPDRGPDCPA